MPYVVIRKGNRLMVTSDYVRLRKMALCMCRKAGIRPQDIGDAASDVVHRIRRRPAKRRYAAALYVIRMKLAQQLGVPWRGLSGSRRHMHAIGDHEAILDKYMLEPQRKWRATFDYHSSRFAVENQVCPRCSAAGRFADEGGACMCGFSYGRPDAADKTGDDAAERVKSPQRRKEAVPA